MPMFPLGTVLLPGMVLPLHVFEPRYQQLVRDCVDAAPHEFGVVLIDRGSEVGGGDTRSAVGVVAEMLQVVALEGNRFALVTVGTRRVRIVDWLPDDPYPRADVEDWPDGDATCSPERLSATAARARRCAGLAVEMGDRAMVPEGELTGDLSADSFILAGISPLGPADQYTVLCATNPSQRLDLIDELLDGVEAGFRFRLG
ncbi:MAG TPA: LON peptidase substrate-binding domain-containing protein [Ilumatobacteraceae bacterium]|nr:LON peptidase substrate-binding domain-containing protein [Ilumatobacteraceae bacterium]